MPAFGGHVAAKGTPGRQGGHHRERPVDEFPRVRPDPSLTLRLVEPCTPLLGRRAIAQCPKRVMLGEAWSGQAAAKAAE